MRDNINKVQAHCNPRSCGCKELSRQRYDNYDRENRDEKKNTSL